MTNAKGFNRRTAWKIRKDRRNERLAATLRFYTTFEIDMSIIDDLRQIAGWEPMSPEEREVRSNEFVQRKLKEVGFN